MLYPFKLASRDTMPRPCSNLMPPDAEACLILAQFVPSFALVLKSLSAEDQPGLAF